MIILCMICCGCYESEYYKNLRTERDKTTITESYYCTTIVHDDHLFIMSNSGYFIHHIDCPCSKNKTVTKEEKSPIIIDFGILR